MGFPKVSKLKPLELKPELLTQPNIPKPLHGLSPRTIMGRYKWDLLRVEIYKKYHNRCIVCGVSKLSAKRYKRLEAHENWDINYTTGICAVKSIEPLCNFCHSFIHSGKLTMDLQEKRISLAMYKDILKQGFSILGKNHLSCFPSTLGLAKLVGIKTNVKSYTLKVNPDLEWADYRVKFNNKLYKPLFKNMLDWEEHYALI